MFERCDFLLGADYSVVIVIAGSLPDAETYTVSVSDQDIRFKAGYESIAEMPYQGGEIFQRIANNTQVGLVEYDGSEFPATITHVAYVEVRRSV
ncbi:MAG: hypothetical protein H6867_05180 [Rhodospirillales bacterium]|nr:hypothetical protein [Rhodospirillales bacterium]MCB9994921.1 hypothetical protein [Rhodospirillales bacterium]